MRILFLDQYGDLGGAQRCLVDIVKGVLDAGWEAFAALPEDGALSDSLGRMEVSVSRIPCGPFSSGHKTGLDVLRFVGQWPIQVVAIKRLVKALSPDVLYINGPRLVPAGCAAAGGTVPVLFHCHSLPDPGSAWLVRRSLSRAQRIAVIAGSRYVARPFEDRVRSLRIIYNGVADCSTAARSSAESRVRIGVVGRIAPQKGQLEFVQAARILARSLDGIRFVICGAPLFSDRAASDYFQAVREESAGLSIDFTGWQPDVRAVLSQLDVLVVPSTGAESTTRVILEAYSAGVPVVAFRSGGIPEVVEHGVTGVLVSPSTPDALAAALLELLRPGGTAAAALAERARKRWEEQFTVERFTRQILESIRWLSPIAGRRARPAAR